MMGGDGRPTSAGPSQGFHDIDMDQGSGMDGTSLGEQPPPAAQGSQDTVGRGSFGQPYHTPDPVSAPLRAESAGVGGAPTGSAGAVPPAGLGHSEA